MSDDIAIGTRVRVMDIDKNDLGLGTYEGEVALDDNDNEIPIPYDAGPFDSNPKIRLDSGRVIYGFDCWWTPTDDQMETDLATIESFGQTVQ
jgi:hypothetical protein